MTNRVDVFGAFHRAITNETFSVQARTELYDFVAASREFSPLLLENPGNRSPNLSILNQLGLDAEDLPAYLDAYSSALLQATRNFADMAHKGDVLSPTDVTILSKRLLDLGVYGHQGVTRKAEAVATLFPFLPPRSQHFALTEITTPLYFDYIDGKIDPDTPLTGILVKVLREKGKGLGEVPDTVGAYFEADQAVWSVDALYADAFATPDPIDLNEDLGPWRTPPMV